MGRVLDDALALPGAFLLGVCLWARVITPRVRRTLGRKICMIAYRQLLSVASLQRHLRHPLLDVLCRATALTVSVEFYLLALPPLAWLAGQHGFAASIAICQCMAVSTYMTCVLKDMLSSPRPYMFVQPDGGSERALVAAPAAVVANAPTASASVSAAVSPYEAIGTIHRATVTAVSPDLDEDVAADVSPHRSNPLGKLEGSPRTVSSTGTQRRPPGKPGRPRTLTQIAGRDSGSSAQVAVLEDVYRSEIEYGAPSMHTWCALVLPAYTAVVAHQLGSLSTLQCAAVGVGVGCWASWVALTRLYLGVHTPVDLVLGAVGGGAVLGLWRRFGLGQVAAVGLTLPQATFAMATKVGVWAPCFGLSGPQHHLALAAVGVLYVTALATYPIPESHTTSYEYAVIFLGAAYGSLLSSNSGCSLALVLLRRPASWTFNGNAPNGENEYIMGGPTTTAEVLAGSAPEVLQQPVAVLLLGFAITALVKVISKAVLSELLPKLLDLAPLWLRLTWQPPLHPSACVMYGRHKRKVGEMVYAASAAAYKPLEGSCGRSSAQTDDSCGVFMKTLTLPYDVDFLRKFLNYGITVYTVMEYRHIAGLLLHGRSYLQPLQ